MSFMLTIDGTPYVIADGDADKAARAAAGAARTDIPPPSTFELADGGHLVVRWVNVGTVVVAEAPVPGVPTVTFIRADPEPGF